MRTHKSLRTKLASLVAAALAVVAAAQSGCERAQTGTQAPRAAPPAKVRVVVARKMNVPIIGRPNGTTKALSDVTIRARVKGFLKEKHFDEGSNVKKDQLLLVIDEQPFKVRVDQAKAVLDEAEAALKKAQQSKSREVAKAQVALDETQLQLDTVEERRERNLLARKAASQEDLIRPRPRPRRARRRSSRRRRAWNRPWPITTSTSWAPRPRSRRPGRTSNRRGSSTATAACPRRSSVGQGSSR